MTYLLDVNVLIALIDPLHAAHNDAHAWFEKEGHHAWATCPITENGVIRIVGKQNYPNTPGSPAAVAAIVDKLRRMHGHRFWPDDVSLFDADEVDTRKILTSRQVTDTYLLALAKTHGGQLATFDRRLSTVAIGQGRSAVRQIEAAAS